MGRIVFAMAAVLALGVASFQCMSTCLSDVQQAADPPCHRHSQQPQAACAHSTLLAEAHSSADSTPAMLYVDLPASGPFHFERWIAADAPITRGRAAAPVPVLRI